MRLLEKFEEFLEKGTIQERTPDFPRANYLIEEAKKRKTFFDQMINNIGLTDENANYFIETSYDILIELIRAKLIKAGFSSSGEGAHEAEVSFMEKLNFSEKDLRFMDDLRYFRNGILYYGKSFDSDYAKKVIEYLKKTYLRLLEP